MERVSLLHGVTKNRDADISALALTLLGGRGAIYEGLVVTNTGTNQFTLSAGKALVKCQRTTGEKLVVHYHLTENTILDISTDQKIYIAINQLNLDNATLNNTQGTGIGEIQIGSSYPSQNYIAIADIVGGSVSVDNRDTATIDINPLLDILQDYATVSYVDGQIAQAGAISILTETNYPYGEDIIEGNFLYVERNNNGFSVKMNNAFGYANWTGSGTGTTRTNTVTIAKNTFIVGVQYGFGYHQINFCSVTIGGKTYTSTKKNGAVFIFDGGIRAPQGSSCVITFTSPSALSNNYFYGITNNSKYITYPNTSIYVLENIVTAGGVSIGYENTYKRRSDVIYGSGVSGNTIELQFAYEGDPALPINFRIETDTAGKPSGTLVHANAIGSIAKTDITNNYDLLYKQTITLAGNVTLTKNQKYHLVYFVGTYGSEYVSTVNYFYGFTKGALARNMTSFSYDGTIRTQGNDALLRKKSTLFIDSIYSKTSASDTSYLPDDKIIRIATQGGLAGTEKPVGFIGQKKGFSGLTELSTYYYANTFGEISLIPGTVSRKAGYSLSTSMIALPYLSINDL